MAAASKVGSAGTPGAFGIPRSGTTCISPDALVTTCAGLEAGIKRDAVTPTLANTTTAAAIRARTTTGSRRRPAATIPSDGAAAATAAGPPAWVSRARSGR